MNRNELLQPIGVDAPCGPDLLRTEDDDYIVSVFDSEARLPDDFFDLRRETLFEPDRQKVVEDLKRLEALLRRSRDLRMLVLQAKWQILSGRLGDFADSVGAVADLLEAFPQDVHPQITEDEVDRQNALEELNTLAHVPAPLEHAVLLLDRRIGPVTLRAYATGAGLRPLRPGETAGDAAAVVSALGSSENAEMVDALKLRLDRLNADFERIQRLCSRAERFPFTPKFDRTLGRLEEIRRLIFASRSDLLPMTAAPSAVVSADLGDATGTGAAPVAQPPPGAVVSQREARVALEAAERHLARHEPASLALLLVTQARLLIGRPLIEALDMLMEREIDEAVVDFGSQKGFRMPISRLRRLTEEVVVPHGEPGEDAAPEPPEVASREQAGGVLKAVEDFYRRAEPASPIPVLLFKARNLLGKDFHGILRELMPPESDG